MNPAPNLAPRCQPVVMLRLFMRTQDDQGRLRETLTWAVGPDEETTLKDWKRAHPKLAAVLEHHEVVTPMHWPAVGNRSERGGYERSFTVL